MLNLRELLNGLAIKRYHTKRTIKEQTVGEHSGRIAALLIYLLDNPSGALLKAAILHDVSELATGDVPSPVKWNNPVLRAELNRVTTEYEEANGLRVELTEQEAQALRFCDLAEGATFCIDEIQMGNTHMIYTLGRYVDAMGKVPALSTVHECHLRQIALVDAYSNFFNNAARVKL